MTTRIRRLALASAALLLSSAAQAAAVKWIVTIDFETYGEKGTDVEEYKGSGVPGSPPVAAAGSYGPVIFSTGLSIYPISTGVDGDLTGKPMENGSDGYLSNLVSIPNSPPADSVNVAIDAAQNIEHLAFRFSYAAPPSVKLIGTAGKEVALTYNPGRFESGWSDQVFEMSKLVDSQGQPVDFGFLTKIDFSFPNASGSYFALDDLRLGVNDPGTGQVPEPSGVALAALALAAAASASRSAGKGR